MGQVLFMDTVDTHRKPRQGRSQASFERMLAAAESVMAERGDDDFALSDVAKAGKVSIGSIYCRFDSKDSLIQAVQQHVSARIQERQRSLVSRVALHTDSLAEFAERLVDEYADSLREFAPILRAMMQRATRDSIVAKVGKSSYIMVLGDVTKAMMRYREEIAHSDPERAVQSAFNVLFATVARALSLGSTVESAERQSWQQLKDDLAHMFTSFLVTTPRTDAPLRTASVAKKAAEPKGRVRPTRR